MKKVSFLFVLFGLVLFGCTANQQSGKYVNPNYVPNTSVENEHEQVLSQNLSNDASPIQQTQIKQSPPEKTPAQIRTAYPAMLNRNFVQWGVSFSSGEKDFGLNTSITDFYVLSNRSTGISKVVVSLIVENLGKSALLVYCGDYSILDKKGRKYELSENLNAETIQPGLVANFECSQIMPIDSELDKFVLHRAFLGEQTVNISSFAAYQN